MLIYVLKSFLQMPGHWSSTFQKWHGCCSLAQKMDVEPDGRNSLTVAINASPPMIQFSVRRINENLYSLEAGRRFSNLWHSSVGELQSGEEHVAGSWWRPDAQTASITCHSRALVRTWIVSRENLAGATSDLTTPARPTLRLFRCMARVLDRAEGRRIG